MEIDEMEILNVVNRMNGIGPSNKSEWKQSIIHYIQYVLILIILINVQLF